jgi:hypothetical protein
MFFARKNFPLWSPCVIETIPGAFTWPAPTKYSTLFFLKRNSTPLAICPATARERSITLAKSKPTSLALRP